MLNPAIKKLLMAFFVTRITHDYLVGLYRRYLFISRCRLLQRVGPSILADVHRALSSMGIQYFADYGTLLGIIREKGFIKHDDDIDFSIPVGAVTPERLMRAIDRIGDFSFAHAFASKGKISELSYHCRGVQVDFFFLEELGGKTYAVDYLEPEGNYELFQDPWPKRRQERCVAQGLHEVRLGDIITVIPTNYEQILTMTYGDWKTPMKGWKGQVDSGQRPYEMNGDLGMMLNAHQTRELVGLA